MRTDHRARTTDWARPARAAAAAGVTLLACATPLAGQDGARQPAAPPGAAYARAAAAPHPALPAQHAGEPAGAPAARRISLDLGRVTIGAALQEVEARSGVPLSYSAYVVPIGRLVSVSMSDVTVADALRRILAGTGVGVHVTPAGQVLLVRRDAARAARARRQGTLAGQVTDTRANPLVGALVRVSGTALRAMTNPNGNYAIRNVEPGPRTLVVSQMGFRPETVTVVVAPAGLTYKNVVLRAVPYALQGLVVQGQREGQARALNEQRTALNFKNVVATEQIEQFPDASIAEALQRVPGVAFPGSYELSNGLFVRGIGGGLNSITVNGERIPSTEGQSRGTNIDIVLSDMVAAMEVTKALTPDMDADAIGGSINLVTRRPDRPILHAKVASAYNGIDGEAGYDLTLIRGGRAGKLGYIVGGSYLKDHFSEERLQTRWGRAAAAGGDSVTLPTVLEFADYETDSRRYGLNTTFDYRLGDSSSVYLRGTYDRGLRASYSPTYSVRLGTNLVAPGQVAGARAERFARLREWDETILMLSAGGRHALPALTVDYLLAFSRGNEYLPTYIEPHFLGAPFGATYDAADRREPQFAAAAGGADPSDAGQYRLSWIRDIDKTAPDRDLTAALNLTRPFALAGGESNLKFGAKFRAKSKVNDVRVRRWDVRGGSGPLLSDLQNGYSNDEFFRDRYAFGPAPDAARTLAASGDPAIFAENVAYGRRISDQETFEASEDVAAGYGMATLQFGKVTLLGGARYEHTRLANLGNIVRFDTTGQYAATEPVRARSSYGAFYPMAHLRYQVDERTNIRLAATRARARPSYYALAPYEQVSAQTQAISRGNPDLRPSSATNVDLLFERYFQSVGLLSGDLFYKRVHDFIINRRFEEQSGPYAGYEVSQPQNGNAARVYGVEASWQQQLTFLPRPLAGFGVYANYTYTRSRAELDGAERTIPLPSTIPHVLNAALSYGRSGFFANLAAKHYGRFVESVGGTAAQDRLFAARTQLDLVVSQRLVSDVNAYAELSNLTNAPFFAYLGTPGSPYDQRTAGRWARAGVKYGF